MKTKRIISIVLIAISASMFQGVPTAHATAPGKPVIGGATCNTYTAIWSFTMTSTTAVTGFKYAFTTHLVDTAPTTFYDFAGSFTQSGDSYTITFNSGDYVTAGKTTGEQARPWIKGVSGSDIGDVNNVRYLSCPVTLETPNAATKIVLTTQAGGGATGLAFTTQPQLTLQDASSNTVTGSTPVITATVTTSGDQKESYLVGTTTANVVSGTGLATFVDLGLNAVLNQNYTVTFSSPGLTSATQVFTAAAVRIPEYPSNLSVSQISDSNVYRITFPAPNGGGSTIVNYQYSFDESTWYDFNPAYGSGTPVTYDIDLSSQVAKSAWDFYFRTVTSFGVSRSSYDIRNSSRGRVSIGAAGGMGPPVSASTRRPTVVSGSLVIGATLQNRVAFVGATPMTYEYKWQSCTSNTDLTTCVDVAGATESTFLVTTNQVDKYIRNIVTATNSQGDLTSVSALTNTSVSGTDTTPPTVTLAATAANSSSATITFTVTGNEAIACSTLSTASGTDFTYSGITEITGIVQTSSTVCTITATSSATAGGGAVTSTLTAAGSFSMTDTAGNAQTTLTGSPKSTVVTISDTDTTPPTITATSASGVTSSATRLNFTSSEVGTYFFLVYGASVPEPNAATIEAQGSAVKKGTGSALARANSTVVTGLTADTNYKAYLVVKDAAGNISAVSTISFRTKVRIVCDDACRAAEEAARAAAEAAARAAAEAAARAAAKVVSDAAAKVVAEKVVADKTAAEVAAKAAVEKATAAVIAKAAADAAAIQAATIAKAAEVAQAEAVDAASKATATLKSATTTAAANAAATATATKAATTAQNAVKAAAAAAKTAATARAAVANASQQVDIAIGALGSKTAAAKTTAQANAIAAAAKNAANKAAKVAADQAAAVKVLSDNANKEATIAAERIATEQKEATTAAAEAKIATDAALTATNEKISVAAEAQKSAEAVVKALDEKVALAEASVKAKDVTERAAIEKRIEEATVKVAEAQRVADAAKARAEAAVVAEEKAQNAAALATERAQVQAAEVVAVKAESVIKTAAAIKAAEEASLAVKVATAAKAAAAKIPSKAVISAKAGATGKNSAKATITGLKPGQKVKVTVNVKGN
jgi:hypothetical protein